MANYINTDCIIPSIAGRLGNNMFMIAHAYVNALEQNKQLVVPKQQVGHMNDFSDNIFRKIDLYVNMPNDVPTATVYTGYFQNVKCFEKYSEAVKQLFSPTLEFLSSAYKKHPFLAHHNTTAISVRRGDYLIYTDYHPVVTKEYINAALQHTPPSRNLMMFSDDVDWCRENFENVHIVEAPIYEQMWLMSLCDDFVISNSSFSWWGAYLSRQPNKIVVAPETWYGPNGPKEWNDIYCEGWTVLPTYYENGYIFPK